MTQRSRASYVLPALIYVLIVGTAFSADVQPVLVEAFGAEPFGYPVALVVAIAQAVLWLPFVFAIHHFMLIVEQANKDGRSIGRMGLLAYTVDVGRRHPQLRRSQVFSIAGLAYFVAICGAWIAYADAKGI